MRDNASEPSTEPTTPTTHPRPADPDRILEENPEIRAAEEQQKKQREREQQGSGH
jgi:outer membrane protein TolC